MVIQTEYNSFTIKARMGRYDVYQGDTIANDGTAWGFDSEQSARTWIDKFTANRKPSHMTVTANCSNGEYDLHISHAPDADLDGTFTAWDHDEACLIRINGWQMDSYEPITPKPSVRPVTAFIGLVTCRNGTIATMEFGTDSPLSGFAMDQMPPEIESVEIIRIIHGAV